LKQATQVTLRSGGCAQPKIGNNKARQVLTELIADAALFEWRIPRPRTNPAIHISRYEQPIA
jgi:hypothetical protein